MGICLPKEGNSENACLTILVVSPNLTHMQPNLSDISPCSLAKERGELNSGTLEEWWDLSGWDRSATEDLNGEERVKRGTKYILGYLY